MAPLGAVTRTNASDPCFAIYGARSCALYVRRLILSGLSGDVAVAYASVALHRLSSQPTDGLPETLAIDRAIDSEAAAPTLPTLLCTYGEAPATVPSGPVLAVERVLAQTGAAAAARPSRVDFDLRACPVFLGDPDQGLMLVLTDTGNLTLSFSVWCEWLELLPWEY